MKKMLHVYVGDGKGVPLGERTPEELQKLLEELLSEGQVHLPVRLFARDMANAGFPVLRYEIRWTPEQVRPYGG